VSHCRASPMAIGVLGARPSRRFRGRADARR
jgi:hypothetical protein